MANPVWILSFIAAWVLVVAQFFAVFGMFWAVGRINSKKDPNAKVLITEDGPPIYSRFPWFEAYIGDSLVFATNAYKGKQWVLLLLSPECEPCCKLLKIGVTSALKDWDPFTKLVIVLEGEAAEEGVPDAPHFAEVEYIVDKEITVRRKLGVENTPYGFLMDASGTIRMKGVVNSSGQLLGLSQANGRHMEGASWQEDTV